MSALSENIGRADNKALQPQRNAHINLTFPHLLCALAAILLAASSALSQKPAAGEKPLPPGFDKASDALQWASNQTAVARLLAERGQYKESERLFRELVSLYTEKLGPEHTNTLTSRHGLALVLDAEDRPDEAVAEALVVLKLRERILGADDPETLKTRRIVSELESASALYDRSAAALERQEYEQAERLALASAGLAKKDQLLDHSSIYRAFHMAGHCALKRSNAVIALAHFTNAAGFIDKSSDIFEWGHNQGDQAKALEADLQYPQAERLVREVLAVLAKELGPEDAVTLAGRKHLASLMERQGKREVAESEYRELIQIQRRVLGAEHPETLNNRIQLALLLYRRGKFVQAEAEYRELLPIAERVCGPEDQVTVGVLYNLAVCINRPSRAEEAREYARRAAEGYRKLLGPEGVWTKQAEELYKQLTPKK
ncbi:MAG TPA: tetratricopeptide repeat protein [Verrucomicrobiae bacterium]|nr:tetratricopeptide repeat protein [Verrucomicrobiae bacterium]